MAWDLDDIERRIAAAREERLPKRPAYPRRVFEPKRPESMPARLQHIAEGKGVPSYSRLFDLQEGVCALCAGPPDPGERLQFDHDHRCHPTNICRKCFRGLLCRRCNVGLGLVDRVGLEPIARYLSAFEDRS